MKTKTDSLLEFLDSSPCNFLAVDTIRRRLIDAGFEELNLADAWQLQAGKKYFTTKNDTAVFAFVVGSRPASETGFRLIAAHSDSPCFRIKPNAEMLREGVVSINTEVYGGPILYTWFDRPLSLAGRVMLRGADALHPRSV
ncbi:MAG: M18 family aminopeptidase, partial [Bacteroidales bacterium]|nr:M18 family aminopeptidase [Bacteroidales bacterium]